MIHKFVYIPQLSCFIVVHVVGSSGDYEGFDPLAKKSVMS